ncbi:putative bifunctional diguanylate cyclase/phosphodiesterase [Pengzhenrongella frigida]|uniref:putative bifunctional diguanylate cyclase/phosphodiesterase n=1 Tax=Pengzhenrongella frigida TaxID=1259133 RepID=UPI001A91775E|nr:bifunctional diguanylate cyclase/phosphodiesterase [Cellulomonas sp. HLT2-17]
MTDRRRRRGSSRLLAIYAAASLVPVSILGAVLVQDYRASGLERGRDQGRAQAAVIAEMAIAPALSGLPLSEGLSSDEYSRLRSATDLSVFSGSVSHLRLRTFRGLVAFSDDGAEEDVVPAEDPAFQVAAAGGTDVRIIGGEGDTRTIRVLQPVISASTGQWTGVLELYLPYDAIAAGVQAETNRAILRLGAGLGGLYAVLALISWWTTRSLRRHAAAHEHLALHDPLTGLPNRELFRRTVERALVSAHRGESGALVLIDLDHFKEVNDTLGHPAGDELLRVVGHRLADALRTDDTVARLGGDEFGLVLPGSSDPAETVALLTRVREALSQVVVLDGVALTVQASFGVCFYPGDAVTLEGLLRHADAAMYQGKHGPTGVVVYEPTTARPAAHGLVLQRELHDALERDELVLHYQPKIDLATGRTGCVEALVRWQHPVRGLLPPAEFLPVAERSELIDALTSWVLRRALADYAAWTAAGHDWTVAVNVSARNLASLDFADLVAQILDESGVRPERLQIEVTETALTFDTEIAEGVVNALAAQGISIAIDDFGVGYTSLSQLRTLTVAELKIDREFVLGLTDNEHDRAIVRSVIDLGHNLGCRVTAEGVETQQIADWLVAAGCDLAQGYLWLRPAPWPEVASLATGREEPMVSSTRG